MSSFSRHCKKASAKHTWKLRCWTVLRARTTSSSTSEHYLLTAIDHTITVDSSRPMDPPTTPRLLKLTLRETWEKRIESLKHRERKLTSLHPLAPLGSNQLKKEFGASKLMAPELFWAVKRRDVSDNVSNFLAVLEELASEDVIHISDIMEQVTRGGNTILHLAVQNRSQEILRLTANHFPQLITRTNMAGDTALHLAARNKGEGLINRILTCYAERRFPSGNQFYDKTEMNLLRMKNEIGNTALHEAVRALHLEGARLLFEADKDVANYLNDEGKSPLYLAVETGHDDIIDLLLQAPLQNQERHHGTSPLHAAIMAMSSVQISKHKFQPLVVGWVKDSATNFEASPTTAKINYCEKILRKNSELVYLKDQKGGTALHLAASMGNLEVVRTVLNAGPLSALEWDLKGYLPIHIACKKGHINVVKEFVQKPEPWFDPMDSLNQKGQNILHIAAKNGKDKVVKYILREKKLEKLLNMGDKKGNTPLHLASKYLHPKILLLLTQEKRLDINLVNKKGMTARDIVMLRRRTPPTFREFLSFTILKSIGTPLSENGRRIRCSHTEQPQIKWIKDRVSTILLVAILVATVTFAAGFTMPGGVYSLDEKDTKKRGMATFLNKAMFQLFTICDVIAMYSSTMGSFILLWAQLGDFHMACSATYFALHLVGLALITMSIAFMAAVHLVVSNVYWLANTVMIIGIIFLLMLMGVFILLTFPLGERALFFHHISNFIFSMVIPFSGSYGKLTGNVKVKKIKMMYEKEKSKDRENTQRRSKMIVRQCTF